MPQGVAGALRLARARVVQHTGVHNLARRADNARQRRPSSALAAARRRGFSPTEAFRRSSRRAQRQLARSRVQGGPRVNQGYRRGDP